VPTATGVRHNNSVIEVDRRAQALIQAQRIQEHLPHLYRQLYQAEQGAGDLRQLIADEKQAIKDLHYEAEHELGQIHARDRNRARRERLDRLDRL
jgi:UDP-glucose 4-epimerase